MGEGVKGAGRGVREERRLGGVSEGGGDGCFEVVVSSPTPDAFPFLLVCVPGRMLLTSVATP